jgi:hypothetical protein
MENFAEQSKAEEGGDQEATSADMEFVKAMEYGMPIQAGFGMGIERIIAILTQQDNLRDVVMFPLMKPENQGGRVVEKIENKAPQKSPSTNEENDPHGHVKIDLRIVEATLAKYSTTTKDHNLTVGRCMRYFGQKLAKNADYWYAVGVLHDVDWDLVEKDAGRHCGESLEQILAEMNAPE